MWNLFFWGPPIPSPDSVGYVSCYKREGWLLDNVRIAVVIHLKTRIQAILTDLFFTWTGIILSLHWICLVASITFSASCLYWGPLTRPFTDSCCSQELSCNLGFSWNLQRCWQVILRNATRSTYKTLLLFVSKVDESSTNFRCIGWAFAVSQVDSWFRLNSTQI